jgi:hypothetical protein
MESGDLHHTPIDLPDDDILTRVGNRIGGKMTETSRSWKLDALLDLKKEAEKLFREHSSVFKQANILLKASGMETVSFKGVSFKEQDFTLNNDLSNDDWILDFDALADKVRDFLNTSSALVERLINGVERLQENAEVPSVAHETCTATA